MGTAERIQRPLVVSRCGCRASCCPPSKRRIGGLRSIVGTLTESEAARCAQQKAKKCESMSDNARGIVNGHWEPCEPRARSAARCKSRHSCQSCLLPESWCDAGPGVSTLARQVIDCANHIATMFRSFLKMTSSVAVAPLDVNLAIADVLRCWRPLAHRFRASEVVHGSCAGHSQE
jgi:hypothetical protein